MGKHPFKRLKQSIDSWISKILIWKNRITVEMERGKGQNKQDKRPRRDRPIVLRDGKGKAILIVEGMNNLWYVDNYNIWMLLNQLWKYRKTNPAPKLLQNFMKKSNHGIKQEPNCYKIIWKLYSWLLMLWMERSCTLKST